MIQPSHHKKSFAILIAVLLIFIFSSITLSIVETKIMTQNIDSYKYFHIQSKLHLEYIENYILKYNQIPNSSIWDNNNENYNIDIIASDDRKIFDIFVSPKEDIEVRVHKKVIID